MGKTTMNSFRAGESLSHRLRKLHSFYRDEKHIWDIGCDHGLLGLSFNDNQNVESINLVDPAAPVIEVLKKKLNDSYITKAAFYHKKGQEIYITTSSNCIFIAGMGGKEIGEILLHLLPMLDETSQVIISPHRKILELRALLHSLPFSLLEEHLLEEEGQFYQMMALKKDPSEKKVSLYGEDIWNGEEGQKYLDHQLTFFSVHRDEASQGYVEYLKTRKMLKLSNNP